MGDQIMVVWRRLGKEHGEGEGFRLNSPDVVKRHLSEKIERFRPERRWHRVSDNVIVEKADPSGAGFGEDTWIYYLQAQRWAVIEKTTQVIPNGRGMYTLDQLSTKPISKGGCLPITSPT